MRKLMILTALILCMGCLLGACRNSGNEENSMKTEEPTREQPTDAATEPATEEPKLEKLTVGGAELSEYTVIYARNSYYKVLSGIRDQLKGDYDFDHLTAQRLADLIYERFGVRMTVAQDTKTKAGEKEILIGKTNRKLHPETLGADDYTVSLTEGKLVVCGGAFGTTWHAIDAIEAWLAQKAQDGKTADFTVADSITGTYHLKTVACIGDSITYGATSTDPQYLSFPANMQRILWHDYLITNYGHSGKTMRDDLQDSYMATETWQRLLADRTGYDLVLLMLGTNDSHRDPDWDTEDDSRFKRSCKTLLKAVKEKNPNATLVMMNCPKYFDPNGKFASPHIRELQLETAKWLNAGGFRILFYDMYSFTEKEMGASLFPDNLHPGDAGYVVMGKGVAQLVRAVTENGKNRYLVDPGA